MPAEGLLNLGIVPGENKGFIPLLFFNNALLLYPASWLFFHGLLYASHTILGLTRKSSGSEPLDFSARVMANQAHISHLPRYVRIPV
ncbi:hypothetical protein BJX64DRAFT_254688 [Aspergillus heterothallicus]